MLINKPRFFQKPLSPIPPSGMERTVVLAPHQDDETLGCGGRIIQLKNSGAQVKVVYTTDGRLANNHLMDQVEVVQIRRREAIAACKELGVPEQDVIFLNHHDGNLPNEVEAASESLYQIFQEMEPTELIIPFLRDHHPDHEATSKAARVGYTTLREARHGL
ncbi:MAG: PIG-L family deacetylase [Verrucomicrobia bacterium]|nr:PIG-L family deacetylase [Verrucomicrobiota bacterium]